MSKIEAENRRLKERNEQLTKAISKLRKLNDEQFEMLMKANRRVHELEMELNIERETE